MENPFFISTRSDSIPDKGVAIKRVEQKRNSHQIGALYKCDIKQYNKAGRKNTQLYLDSEESYKKGIRKIAKKMGNLR